MNPIAEPSIVNEAVVDGRSRELGGSSIGQRPLETARADRSIVRRLVKTSMLAVAVVCGAIFGLYKMRVDIPALNTPKVYAFLDSMSVRAGQLKARVVGQYEAYFHKGAAEEIHREEHKVLVTEPVAKDVTITQDYVCLIRSRKHIDVCAFEDGYIKAVQVREGQAVKEGELMFELVPVLYKARFDAEVAEKELAQLELTYTTALAKSNGVSPKEVALYKAKLARAQANLDKAQAELNFTQMKAPFDGIVDRLKDFPGSLVKEGDVLTTLSDNNVMWVYFNVTEKRYLEYMAETDHGKQGIDVELVLANHTKFPHVGKIDLSQKVGAIEANFNPETGNIAFRADFPNPDGLLRHGQTGTVLIRRTLKDAIVIPQRATFENLAKRYVYVVDKDKVAHQREITIRDEQDDIYVIEKGVQVGENIVYEGVRQVHDGEKLESEFRDPAKVLENQKNHAE